MILGEERSLFEPLADWSLLLHQFTHTQLGLVSSLTRIVCLCCEILFN